MFGGAIVMMRTELGKVGINFNGNLGDDELIEKARIVRKSGIGAVWIGEFEGFKDPFHVGEVVCDEVEVVGFGVLSPLRRSCRELLERLIDFLKRKSEVIVGIAPGEFENAEEAVKATIDCVKHIKNHLDVPVVAGCSSPYITRRSSQIADGILFNYVKPEYIRWISKYAEKNIFTAAYGPSLILNSENEFYESLLIASSIVISSWKFVEEFGLQGLYEEIKKIDFERLIEVKHSTGTIRATPEYAILSKYSGLLLENFSISGSEKRVAERIGSLLNYCDHVILGDPFFRDDRSMSLLKGVVKAVERKLE